MGNYLDNENQDSADDTPEVRQVRQGVRQVRQTPEGDSTNPLHLLRENGGSDGTRTRGLRRDRPAL